MNGNRWPSWLKSYLARYKRAAMTALGLGLFASACSALLMFTSGYLISATALSLTTLFSVMVPVACVQLFGLGRPFARYAERLASHDWVLRVTSDLRLALFRSIEERTDDPARERATGEYLALLSDDVAHLQNLYLRVVFPSIVAYLLAILASLLFGFFSLPFAGVMLVSLFVVTFVVPAVTLLATRASMERAKILKGAETTALADDVYGSLDWVLADRSAHVIERHERNDSDVRSLEASIRMRQRVLSLVATILLGVLLCAVIAWSGSSFGQSSATANWIAAFTLGFFPLIEAFAVLPVAFSESTTHQEAVKRLDGYLGPAADTGMAPSNDVGRTVSGAVELDGVSYAYPGARRPALDGMTLSIDTSSSTAILGRSGSGKSTLVKLVCGSLAPDAGTVSVSGCVGHLGQEPYLFNRSLRDNLSIGAPGIADERLITILASVGLGEKFDALPAGLDTVIGETGVGFSGGEAHRVALARVLAVDAPIVIVDEPFSALDPETEHELLDTLFDVCSDKTLIVVTHHLAEIERFDRVIFIEDARIDLDGAPQSLLESNPRFRSLVAFDRA